jgi:serine/threonine protein kinase
MTPEQIDRVFGRGRLKMATGDHVEVFREAAARGERRRYTKRFLKTPEGDFGQWTEREWRILARLVGHGIGCVPEVVQFDRGAMGMPLVQTYDAGATVDQWATILPVTRDSRVRRHIFEDCAHWWALAHHCLVALDQVHALELIHLDIKGDNVCIPLGPAHFDPEAPELLLYPLFDRLALIDFAFSLVARESLPNALPIGWQKDYDYQSPRLLQALEAGRQGDLGPTRELDWRCDLYSLGAMLKRYLPDEGLIDDDGAAGWTLERYDDAKRLLLGIREAHDRAASQTRPHREFIAATRARLSEPGLRASLDRGWTLARDARVAPLPASPITPLTRLAPSIRIIVSPRDVDEIRLTARTALRAPPREASATRTAMTTAALVTFGLVIGVASWWVFEGRGDALVAGARSMLELAQTYWDRLVASIPTGDFRTQPPVAPSEPEAPPGPSPAAESTSTPAPAATNDVPRDQAAADADRAPAVEESAARNDAPTPSPSPAAQSVEEDRTNVAPPSLASTPPASHAAVRAPAAPRSGGRVATPSSRAPTVAAKPHGAGRSASVPSRAPTIAAAKPRTGSVNSGKERVAHAAPPKPITSSRVQLAAADAGRVARPTPASENSSSASSAQPAKPATAEKAVAPVANVPVEPLRVESPVVVAQATSEPQRTDTLAPTPSSPPAANPAEPRAQPSPPPAARPRPESRPSSTTTLSSFLDSLFSFARQDGKVAPIEDRGAVVAASPSRAAPRPAPTVVASAAPRDEIPPAVPPAPETAARAQTPPPASNASWGIASPAAAATLPAVGAAPAPSPATPAASSPIVTPLPAPSTQQPAPRMPPPVAVWAEAPARYNVVPYAEYVAQAKRTLGESVFRSAALAEADASRVMGLAATAWTPDEESVIADAARRVWTTRFVPPSGASLAPGVARQFDEAARRAYGEHRDINDVFGLQLRAFGANPSDPDIAGNLAFVYLKLSPPQPETARQVALHAMALRGTRLRAARPDDWTTFAIASALVGREDDARNALYVAVALTRDLDLSCRAVLSSIASYGDPMRRPVRAMMERIQAYGRTRESPYCNWPPQWVANNR